MLPFAGFSAAPIADIFAVFRYADAAAAAAC